MSDEFEATFVVDLAPEEVWQSLVDRTVPGDAGSEGTVHYVLPGFPSFEPLPIPGARCTVIEEDPGRLLRVKKDHHPCLGTEIGITLEHAESGTRVTIVQSGFGAFLDFAGRDTVFGHGQQIVNDLQLYLERGLIVPGTAWGVNLGAVPKRTPVGLEIGRVDDGSFGQRAGLETGDLLLTIGGIRIHGIEQLATVLALIDPASKIDITWARGREAMEGSAVPQG